jgi:hypothetical protein
MKTMSALLGSVPAWQIVGGEGRGHDPFLYQACTCPADSGVRIEDIVTVTEDGGRRLNNTSREMHIVS